MFKTLGVLLGGVFVGAIGMEIMRKKCPKKLDDAYSSINKFGTDMRDSFNEGYKSAVEPKA